MCVYSLGHSLRMACSYTAIRSPSLQFNGLYPRNLCKYSTWILFIYRPQRDGMLSWIDWLTIAVSLPTVTPVNTDMVEKTE